jgi:hypothetical protein
MNFRKFRPITERRFTVSVTFKIDPWDLEYSTAELLYQKQEITTKSILKQLKANFYSKGESKNWVSVWNMDEVSEHENWEKAKIICQSLFPGMYQEETN